MSIGWQVMRFFHSVPLVKKCGRRGRAPDRDYISVHGPFHGSATPDETRQVRRFPQIPARARTVPVKSSTPSAMRFELRKSYSGFDLWCRSSDCPVADVYLFPGVHHVAANEGGWRDGVRPSTWRSFDAAHQILPLAFRRFWPRRHLVTLSFAPSARIAKRGGRPMQRKRGATERLGSSVGAFAGVFMPRPRCAFVVILLQAGALQVQKT